jgi:DNA-binding transcriptional LysR family regulator
LGLKIERGLLCHRDHTLATKEHITAEDLARELVLRLPSRTTSPGLETWLSPNYDEGGDVLEVLTFGVMLRFVKLNLGVALVPNLPGGEIEDAISYGKKVCYRPLPNIESATVAAYLPQGGVDCLSGGAKKVYAGIAEFFHNLRNEQTISTGRKK